MQVKCVLFVIYCAVLLLLHMADSQEYCKFEGPANQYAHCSFNDTNRTFDHVPTISHRIEFLSLNEQPLKQLPRNAFGNISSQTELDTITLVRCQIQHIDVDAFLNLDNLQYLVISGNSISHLETGTFQHTEKLKVFWIHINKIEKLQAGLFHNLIYLREVSFSNNSIMSIDKDTFRNTPSLTQIGLKYNKLEYLNPLFTDKFRNITRLLTEGNPWNCNCYLREFYEEDKVRKSEYGEVKPTCQNPPGFRGRNFSSLGSGSFYCVARIILPKNDTRVVSLGANVTLSCSVFAFPAPDIEWHRGPNIIARYDRLGSTSKDLMHYLNYTFTVQEEDLGVYYCSFYQIYKRDKSSTTLTMDVVTK